jgi:hypothetical protein
MVLQPLVKVEDTQTRVDERTSDQQDRY